MSEIAVLPLSDSSALQYLKFERERTRPAADLLAGVPSFDPQSCIDPGCGPGNSTELLVRRFPGSAIAGLDRSDDMLAAAKRRLLQVHFQRADLAVWKPDREFYPKATKLAHTMLESTNLSAGDIIECLSNFGEGNRNASISETCAATGSICARRRGCRVSVAWRATFWPGQPAVRRWLE